MTSSIVRVALIHSFRVVVVWLCGVDHSRALSSSKFASLSSQSGGEVGQIIKSCHTVALAGLKEREVAMLESPFAA